MELEEDDGEDNDIEEDEIEDIDIEEDKEGNIFFYI